MLLLFKIKSYAEAQSAVKLIFSSYQKLLWPQGLLHPQVPLPHKDESQIGKGWKAVFRERH
jgi:hypothetical protein